MKIKLWKANFSTPLGPLVGLASEKGLFSLCFKEQINPALIKSLTFETSQAKIIEETRVWLQFYFKKQFNKLVAPTLDLQGSAFATTAWKRLIKIPVGNTLSYGDLARKLGKPNAARAIGRIMGKNPIILIVPCHRIIGSNGSLTGFTSGLDRKIWLLDHEQYNR